jgi:LysM repeat protein
MSTLTLPHSGQIAEVITGRGFSTNPSGIHLNRRGRLARTFVVLSLAIVLGSLVSVNAGANSERPTEAATNFITVTVTPGDTVWSLAERLAPTSDLRAFVSEVIEINSLASADLAAGQKIRIPLS